MHPIFPATRVHSISGRAHTAAYLRQMHARRVCHSCIRCDVAAREELMLRGIAACTGSLTRRPRDRPVFPGVVVLSILVVLGIFERCRYSWCLFLRWSLAGSVSLDSWVVREEKVMVRLSFFELWDVLVTTSVIREITWHIFYNIQWR